MILLTVEKDHVVALYNVKTHNDMTLKVRRVIKDVEDWKRFIQTEVVDMSVFCSSTMDFPEEFTTSPATIALARALR